MAQVWYYDPSLYNDLGPPEIAKSVSHCDVSFCVEVLPRVRSGVQGGTGRAPTG